MFQIIMHPRVTVKDVGDDSQDEEDEVFHSENEVEGEVEVFYTSPGWHKVREPGNRVPR